MSQAWYTYAKLQCLQMQGLHATWLAGHVRAVHAGPTRHCFPVIMGHSGPGLGITAVYVVQQLRQYCKSSGIFSLD